MRNYGEISSAADPVSVFAAVVDDFVSFACGRAELGPHAPLIQVATPNFGNTQACRMNHRTRMPTGIKKSILLLSRCGVLIVMIRQIAMKS